MSEQPDDPIDDEYEGSDAADDEIEEDLADYEVDDWNDDVEEDDGVEDWVKEEEQLILEDMYGYASAAYSDDEVVEPNEPVDGSSVFDDYEDADYEDHDYEE